MNQCLNKGVVLQGEAYRYEIVRTLGQGSFGITYLANAQIPGPLGTVEVPVALKEFFMKDINTRENGTAVTGSTAGFFDDYRRKFRREALNLSRIQHPNVVKVLEAFDTNGTSYIAMNYIDGGSLDDYIQHRGHLDSHCAREIIRLVAVALKHMHEAGMLHLDLKPGNIMMTSDAKPVIIDFGLSKQYDAAGNPESSTTVGAGTPGYAPIEQSSYREGNDFPVSMDIYALGATLFKMLTGQRPPEASVIFNDGFPEAELAQPWITPQLKACVKKAMAPRRVDRYQNVADFIAALDAAPRADEATSMESHSEGPSRKQEDNTPVIEKTKLETSPHVGTRRAVSATTIVPPATRSLPPQAPKKKGNAFLVLLLILLFLAGAALLTVYVVLPALNKGNTEEVEDGEQFQFDEERVKHVLDGYLTAQINNDFDALYSYYAPKVERYMDARNETREQVLNHHRRYDSFFGVNYKTSDVRWYTFRCNQNGDRIEAVVEEDYRIDRDDKTKNNYFLLEKHFILNPDYQIVSVWDIQLEKRIDYPETEMIDSAAVEMPDYYWDDTTVTLY